MWIYSLGYNAFVFADIAIAIAVGVVVFSAKSFLVQVRHVQATAFVNKNYSDKVEKPAETATENA